MVSTYSDDLNKANRAVQALVLAWDTMEDVSTRNVLVNAMDYASLTGDTDVDRAWIGFVKARHTISTNPDNHGTCVRMHSELVTLQEAAQLCKLSALSDTIAGLMRDHTSRHQQCVADALKLTP